MQLSPVNNLSIYDLDLTTLQNYLKIWGEPDYRGKQIWEGLYQQYWGNSDEFTSLPRHLRVKLEENFSFHNLQPIKSIESRDKQTEKFLFKIKDDYLIETVLMRYGKRNTLCISTQSGCAMGCVFCATGQMGFGKNLTSGEIIEQIIFFSRKLSLLNDRLSNIVIMGMGEPFHNYDNTLNAIDIVNHPQAMNFGSRRFTISTVGVIPEIKRFISEKRQVNLAISLHASTNEVRSKLLPINSKYPIQNLMDACIDYVQSTHRRISFEWALIDGVNDNDEQLIRLCKILQPFKTGSTSLCHVNIIPLNPTQKYSGVPTPHQRAQEFCEKIKHEGISATVRLRRGIEIRAGCGQLTA